MEKLAKPVKETQFASSPIAGDATLHESGGHTDPPTHIIEIATTDEGFEPSWLDRQLSSLRFALKGKPVTATKHYQTQSIDAKTLNDEHIGSHAVLGKLLQILNDAPFPTWRERRAARKKNPDDPTGGAKVPAYDVGLVAEELSRELTHEQSEAKRTRLSLGQQLGTVIHRQSTDVYVGTKNGPDVTTEPMSVRSRSFNLSQSTPSTVLLDQDYDGLIYCALGVTDSHGEEWEWFVAWAPLSRLISKNYKFSGVTLDELAG